MAVVMVVGAAVVVVRILRISLYFSLVSLRVSELFIRYVGMYFTALSGQAVGISLINYRTRWKTNSLSFVYFIKSPY